MTNNNANLDRLIGLRVQVHNTGVEEIDMEGEIDAAWITKGDHVRVLLRQTTGNGVDQWGEWMMEDLKLVKSGLTVTKDELAVAKTRKIEAIKMYRERTKTGLKEAKDAIEAEMLRAFGSSNAACGYCGSHTCVGQSCRAQAYSSQQKPVITFPCPRCGVFGHSVGGCFMKP